MPSRLKKLLPRLHAGQLLVGGGLLIGLALAAAMSWFMITARQGVLDDAVREMRNDAVMLAEEEDRLLLSIDVVQVGLIEHMRGIGVDSPERFAQLMSTRTTHDNLRDRIAGLPYIAAVALFDEHGVRVNNSRSWPPPPMADDQRDFIRELTVASAPPAYIGAPSISKFDGLPIVHLSRAFRAADGRLIGFVVSTIQIDYFEKFFARLPLTGGGAFALYRRDGMLIARYPHVEQKVGRSFGNTPNFHRLLGALDVGEVRQVAIMDGLDRLIVPRSMPHFPLFVTVSDTMESMLLSWRREFHVLIATTALLELLIAGSLLLIIRHLRGNTRLYAAEAARTRAEADLAVAGEHERTATSIRAQEQRFDTAVNNMLQGLIMARHDGTVLVVNHRFCELFGLPRDVIVPGMKYSDLTRLVGSRGNVDPADVAVIAARRMALAGQTVRSSSIWELSDGRAFTVTHQPMPGGWVTTCEDITERRAAEIRIQHLAHHDALTGLPNRVLFRQELEHALAYVRRGGLLALHCLDLDQFKAVNDTLGHPIGDLLLREVAQRLGESSRETDTVARLGGDEFAIVQTAIESPLDATTLADRLIELMEAPFVIDGHQIVIGTSIGIALAPQDGVDADQLLKGADLALYRAKADGRGTFRLFQAEMDAAVQARRLLELDLRLALPAGQLELFYQPQMDVLCRRVAGCEALLRWHHPVKGLIPPDQFIPLAEETGLIIPIGEWVLRRACAAAVQWPDDLRVAVNLSAVQFKSPHLVAAVVGALRESGLHASRLELEITETVMLRDTDATLATLHQLRELGVQIAMDDFGTGYSSLSYLRRFPFDRIKIDQSFVRELGKQEDCSAIVRAVIALGRDLGIAITAEGVESRQQVEALERAGCDELQGYLFSRPVPEAVVAGLLRSMPSIADAWPAPAVRVRSGAAGVRELVPARAV
jgi:diguanylate cyclase (GGDEF)-like protein